MTLARLLRALAAAIALTAAHAQAFDLQGHRGARGLAPENTLAGFAKALEVGVHTLELDVFLSADGVPVVHHDPALNPDLTRDAKGEWLSSTGTLIRALPAAQLAAWDVGRVKPGSKTATDFPAQEATVSASRPWPRCSRSLAPRCASTSKSSSIRTSPTSTPTPSRS